MLTYLVLIAAGFAAGALNAVAGGGTFLSFPALVWIGVPPIVANATATLSALPGYVSSAWSFRRDFGSEEGPLSPKAIILISMAGGLVGALLLLVTSPEKFTAIVPWLLLLATVMFAAGPALMRVVMKRERAGSAYLFAVVLMLAVAIYGGYFNGGLGIMLLAALGLIGFSDLNSMNGLKNIVSALLSLVSVVTYTVAGLIDWPSAVPLAVATAFGGYFGAVFSRRLTNPSALRIFITVVGSAMTLAFFML